MKHGRRGCVIVLLGFGLCRYVGIFFGGVEAGAELHPFGRLDDAVLVAVGAEVAVSENPCIGVGLPQRPE